MIDGKSKCSLCKGKVGLGPQRADSAMNGDAFTYQFINNVNPCNTQDKYVSGK